MLRNWTFHLSVYAVDLTWSTLNVVMRHSLHARVIVCGVRERENLTDTLRHVYIFVSFAAKSQEHLAGSAAAHVTK